MGGFCRNAILLFDRTYSLPVSQEKILQKYWFSSKVYFYFKDRINNLSVLTARKYFNDINYLQLTAGFGTAPDEPLMSRWTWNG